MPVIQLKDNTFLSLQISFQYRLLFQLSLLAVGRDTTRSVHLFDPATRYEGAQKVRGLLPNSSLLTYKGWGHVSIFGSYEADAAVADYLLTGVPPADGTGFYADYVPFGGTLPLAATSARGLAARQFRARLMPDVVVSGIR